jgi:hypothetical protein
MMVGLLIGLLWLGGLVVVADAARVADRCKSCRRSCQSAVNGPSILPLVREGGGRLIRAVRLFVSISSFA